MYIEHIFNFIFDSGCSFTGSEFRVPVRLANGSSPNEGRVEIFYQKRFSGMCKEHVNFPKFATYLHTTQHQLTS